MLILSRHLLRPSLLLIPWFVFEQSHVVQVQMLDRASLTRNFRQILIHEAEKSWFHQILELLKQVEQTFQQSLAELIKDGSVKDRLL